MMSTPNAARDSAKNFSYERVMGSDYSSFSSDETLSFFTFVGTSDISFKMINLTLLSLN